MTGLLLLRHAQSAWNAEARWQGWADPPLSPDGEEQARAAAARLAGEGPPFDLVVTSDLHRARQTGELLAAGLGLDRPGLVEADLREHHVGAWSGLTRSEIAERWPDLLARWEGGELVTPPGGEDWIAFQERVVAAGRRVAASVPRDARILVVAHGGVLRALAVAAGHPPRRIGHLAGYWGSHAGDGFQPAAPVDLLDGDAAAAPAAEAGFTP